MVEQQVILWWLWLHMYWPPKPKLNGSWRVETFKDMYSKLCSSLCVWSSSMKWPLHFDILTLVAQRLANTRWTASKEEAEAKERRINWSFLLLCNLFYEDIKLNERPIMALKKDQQALLFQSCFLNYYHKHNKTSQERQQESAGEKSLQVLNKVFEETPWRRSISTILVLLKNATLTFFLYFKL